MADRRLLVLGALFFLLVASIGTYRFMTGQIIFEQPNQCSAYVTFIVNETEKAQYFGCKNTSWQFPVYGQGAIFKPDGTTIMAGLSIWGSPGTPKMMPCSGPTTVGSAGMSLSTYTPSLPAGTYTAELILSNSGTLHQTKKFTIGTSCSWSCKEDGSLINTCGKTAGLFCNGDLRLVQDPSHPECGGYVATPTPTAVIQACPYQCCNALAGYQDKTCSTAGYSCVGAACVPPTPTAAPTAQPTATPTPSPTSTPTATPTIAPPGPGPTPPPMPPIQCDWTENRNETTGLCETSTTILLALILVPIALIAGAYVLVTRTQKKLKKK